MRRLLTAVAVLALFVGAVPTSAATSLVAGPGPGYIATDNVEWLGTIPLNTDSAGARLLGDDLFVTDDRGITIWDVSDPALPTPKSFTPAPQGAYYVEEDVDTNGKILLLGTYSDLTDDVGALNKLTVYDVSNRAAPKLIGEVAGANSHTITCVLDCTYAYNSDGRIVDLTDPTKPKLTGTRWDAAASGRGGHDVTEVAPGLIVTSSRPILYLDAREDPANPKVIGTGTPGDNRFVHGNLWPQQGTDKFLLVGGETGGDCDTQDAGAFMTFTHATDEATGQTTFTMADEFRLATGVPTEGNSPYDQFCAHWFTTHPTYADGGLVAAGWYEHGTRFLDVDKTTGEITEKGWFYPLGGSTSAAYWVDDEILYSVDYQRGIDILRFTDTPATKTVRVPPSLGYVAPAVRTVPASVRSQLAADPYACPLPGI